MDVARALYMSLTRQWFDTGRAVDGRKWMVEDTDLIAAFCYWRGRGLTVGQWLRSFAGLRETAFLALDDPVPLWRMCANDLSELFARDSKV
jgi:hypothetical protein